MNIKEIFKGFTNLFKSKDKVKFEINNKESNGNYYNERNYEREIENNENIVADRINKDEINFEKLKKISEHTAIYNEKQTTEMITEERRSQNIITNTLINNAKENISVRSVTIEELKNEINTIWDILKIKENTQAEHIIKSTPADKWVTMDEIRHNIKIQFNVEYSSMFLPNGLRSLSMLSWFVSVNRLLLSSSI
ncbi:MAG: hypothetical protein WCF78_01395 [archaeon]